MSAGGVYPATAFCGGGWRKPMFRSPLRSRLPMVAPAAGRWSGAPAAFLPFMFGFILGLFRLVMPALFLPLGAAGGIALPRCRAAGGTLGPCVGGGVGPPFR